MKQVSRFVVAAAALLFASAASAGTLYWQVDDNSGDVTAQLYAQQGDNEAGRTALSNELDAPTGIQQADISAYANDSSYVFYVELLNYSSGTITQGYKWHYGDLISSGYVSFGATNIPDVTANVVSLGSFANAPEPSSGLLLLIGGAMLALRRRRQK